MRAHEPASRSGAASIPPGGVIFAAAARYTEASLDFAKRRFLVVSLPPGATYRHLLRAIDDAVEGALALRGALPREARASVDVEAAVRDQVIRAHTLGLAGIAVMFPQLSREPEGSFLSIEESAFVSAWIGAAQRGLAAVLFDEHDRDMYVLTPRRLADLASSTKPGLRVERSSSSVLPPSPSVRDSIPPSGKIVKVGAEGAPVTLKASAVERIAHALDQLIVAPLDEEKDPPTLRFRGELPPPSTATPPRAMQTEPPPSSVVSSRHGALNRRILLTALGAKASRAEAEPAAPSAPPEALAAPPDVGPPSRSKEEGSSPPVSIQSAPANEPLSIRPTPSTRRVFHGADWRAHAAELNKARGPKLVGVLERLFITRYMPLVGAMSRGEVDDVAKTAIDDFRTDFEHGYHEIISMPRVNGKRPALVSDASDIAAWVGRLSGAHAVKLLLVDAMRFDIGERVVSRLHGRAMCVERILLWGG